MISHEIIEGSGDAFIHSGGDTGRLVALDPTVGCDIEPVGGIKTALSRLAERIDAASRSDREEVKRDFGGTLGDIGDRIGGDK